MATKGFTTVDFGASPGKDVATVAVASSGILADAHVEAWLYPTATTAHSVDEHTMAAAGFIAVQARDIVAGVGFTIYALAIDQRFSSDSSGNAESAEDRNRDTNWLSGDWTVAWIYDNP